MGRKRKLRSSEDSKYLPPCRVCEGPAGGFHYGVNTCEACKGFFHRNSRHSQYFDCPTGGNCPVYFTNPKICKLCRYNKCIAVGMAKRAIKTGRYTVQKRTQDTLEIKGLGSQSQNTNLSCTIKTECHSDYSIKSEDSCAENGNWNLLHRSSSSSPSSSSSSFSSSSCFPSTRHTSNPSPDTIYKGDSSSPLRPVCESGHSMAGGMTNVNTCTDIHNENYQFTDPYIHSLFRDKEEVAHNLSQAQEEYIRHLPQYMTDEELRKKAAEHVDTCAMSQEMFGSMHSLTDQEYDQIYARTGLDADGRQHRLETTSALMELRIRAMANFAKQIPGFNQLNTNDQIDLIKFSRFDMLHVSGYFKVDTEYGVVTSGDGLLRCKHCKFDILGKSLSSANFEQYIKLWQYFNKLQLDRQERAILAAIVMMAPDRKSRLTCPAKVCAIYEELNQCLIYLFRKRSRTPMQLFTKVVNLMVMFRNYDHKIGEFFKRMRFEKYSRAYQNPILREMLDFSDNDNGSSEVVDSTNDTDSQEQETYVNNDNYCVSEDRRRPAQDGPTYTRL